jgi:demethylmenaquinone methyltransferase/2-methoxy-6-polyprenyl-1,4-benzoquinol methylase
VAIINKKDNSVEAMFNGIAHRYDLLNQILSFGIHGLWRKRLVKRILKHKPSRVIDIATGTADVAIAIAKKDENVNIEGVDIADKMIAIGKSKVKNKGFEKRISLSRAYAESLPFKDEIFNVATVAYGVRNFNDPKKGLEEMFRVIKSGGSIHVLEFVNPKLLIIRWIFGFYFQSVLPLLGRLISGHKHAYTYLPKSVKIFAERQDFVKMLSDVGFIEASYTIQSFGIAAIYSAIKP